MGHDISKFAFSIHFLWKKQKVSPSGQSCIIIESIWETANFIEWHIL